MRTRTPLRRPALVASLVIAMAVVAACGSDDEPVAGGSEETTTSTTEATTTSVAESTTTTAAPAEDDGALVGTWTASAADLFAANTANVGGPGLTNCSGDVLMTFADNSTLSRAGNVSCSAGAVEASGTISTTAGYATPEPGHLSVTDTVTLGVATMGGMEIPMPDMWGDGDATFTVDGSTLTIVFAMPSVGEVTQVYTRA